MKKILFIYPNKKSFFSHILDEGPFILFGNMVPHSITLLTSLTPNNYTIKIQTSISKYYKIDRSIDLVCISTLTATVKDAYKLSKKYIQAGKKVIMGGIHPSLFPEEALKYCSTVVCGEAESIWNHILSDFEKSELNRIYYGQAQDNLDTPNLIKRNFFKFKHNQNTIQSTRGCPYSCIYCSVSAYNGKKIRHRSIKLVIQDIINIKKNYSNNNTINLGFVDDNLIADKNYAKSLFTKMIPLNIRWFSQVSIDIAKDDELLDLAYKSGCRFLFIGFESTNQESLIESNKLQNSVKEYSILINKIKKYRILIWGSFMIGFDLDTKETISSTILFAKKSKIDFFSFALLTPLPKTKIYAQMEKEGRILTKDWSKYNFKHCIFKPKNFSPTELEIQVALAYLNTYTIKVIINRLNWQIKKFGLKYAILFFLIYLHEYINARIKYIYYHFEYLFRQSK